MNNLKNIPEEITHNGTTHVKRLLQPDPSRIGDIATMNYAWLDPGKQLTPHAHPDGDEYYVFLDGTGSMLLGTLWKPVEKEAFVIVPENTIHAVKNTGDTPLIFLTVRTVRK